jgi:hypothetical protein
MTERKPYPTDVSDEEWSLVAPDLTLMNEAAPQRRYGLREMFNALRAMKGEKSGMNAPGSFERMDRFARSGDQEVIHV